MEATILNNYTEEFIKNPFVIPGIKKENENPTHLQLIIIKINKRLKEIEKIEFENNPRLTDEFECPEQTRPELSIDYIQKVVCTYFNMSIEILQSNTRKGEIVQARQIAMYFSKNLTKESLATIGSQIGNKDHATVMHACKTISNLYESGSYWDNKSNKVINIRAIIDEIEKKLKQ